MASYINKVVDKNHITKVFYSDSISEYASDLKGWLWAMSQKDKHNIQTGIDQTEAAADVDPRVWFKITNASGNVVQDKKYVSVDDVVVCDRTSQVTKFIVIPKTEFKSKFVSVEGLL